MTYAGDDYVWEFGLQDSDVQNFLASTAGVLLQDNDRLS